MYICIYIHVCMREGGASTAQAAALVRVTRFDVLRNAEPRAHSLGPPWGQASHFCGATAQQPRSRTCDSNE